jgi:hypothetical protein
VWLIIGLCDETPCLGAARARPASRAGRVYSSDDKTRAQIGSFVGKDVMMRGRSSGARMAHHHAPIVMDISDVDEI